ncbi:hypothetical protein [Streptantibioticus ferralitis]|uniref:Uncharacterized protein n=1 Tax=Streptantibioticus ferralitis TaxID=236510 RepID=A0ABT5Z6M0_9ACTN|nr:hypothetical protein [Streptantibioticus ferralitis]MDF2258690.1 hypothetical protein [Streptantibioticus ferralitis]
MSDAHAAARPQAATMAAPVRRAGDGDISRWRGGANERGAA